MRSILLWVVMAAAGLGLAYGAVSAGGSSASAAPAKNLKIYPKGTDTKALKKDMKLISKSLGVECDFCHDMDAFEKDNKHKERARSMMKMVMSINARLKKDGFDKQVTCMTCHQGHEEPK